MVRSHWYREDVRWRSDSRPAILALLEILGTTMTEGKERQVLPNV